MLTKLLSKIFGTRNDRMLKQLRKTVDDINKLEPHFAALSDSDLKNKTSEFRVRFQKGETLDQLLPEAFANVREAAKRVLNMRHFDVQLIGGIVLHKGKIAEMRTGEGKTLVATLPAYLNAIAAQGVHIVTVNDYLAKRDAEWMGPVYQFLGLSTGTILSTLDSEERKQAYAADITYGTNNEFGFDYLRDNMVFNLTEKVQRNPYYAIIDEVDSILIDEARTPLIISGASQESSELYRKLDALIPELQSEKDYYLEEKTKQAYLTEAGHQKAEEWLMQQGLLEGGHSLYHPNHIGLMHHLYAALRAHRLFHKDIDYIVQNQKILIVDEHTGRVLPDRRWSEGLHQAVEAKEKVPIQNENQTLASITFQNYFRLYEKLAGMTGTADTEAYELQKIYNLEVAVIPTNKPIIRKDYPDKVYLTTEEKFKAIIEEIKECRARSQPVLVGTASIENSEKLSHLLKKAGVPHQVLNAKFHEKEAFIIAQAGCPGQVTLATNMAGRGTDIILGGNLEAKRATLANDSVEALEQLEQSWQQDQQVVREAGGLHIIGSERHESRRIDNQLRGRAGRQGDPGSSRFYISLEDNLMRIFAADRISPLMQRLGLQPGEAIEHPWLNRIIENAQRKVEAHNFDIRKHLLEYDDIINEQRKVIYEQRNALLASADNSAAIHAIQDDVLSTIISQHIPPQSLEEQWDIDGLEQHLEGELGLKLPLKTWLQEDTAQSEEQLRTRIIDSFRHYYQEKEQSIGSELLRQLEKSILLQSLDMHWREHLTAMDHLRQSIHLRGYAQRNPKQEYKREAFTLFGHMLEQLKAHTLTTLMRLQIQPAEVAEPWQMPLQATAFEHLNPLTSEIAPLPQAAPVIGRNQPCYCGSGKKYKQCHGNLN